MIKKIIFKLYYKMELKYLEHEFKIERVSVYEYKTMKEYFNNKLKKL